MGLEAVRGSVPHSLAARVGRCVFSQRFDRNAANRAQGLPVSETNAWRAVVRVLRSPVDTVGSAVFPSQCRFCEHPLLHLSRTPVCAECWRDLHEQSTENLCELCGENLGFGGSRFAAADLFAPRLCALCERARPPFHQTVAFGVYEGTLRALIHLLKYERVESAAAPLGALLARSIANFENLPEALTVVAVPLHRLKEHERGFNQTVLLAGACVKTLRKTMPHVQLRSAVRALGRQRGTESQSGLTPHQRRRNLRGAFFVAEPERIAGSAVLLLDDIYTTGATARECTRTLMRGGAAAVYVATLARSQREGVAFWDAAATRYSQPLAKAKTAI
jgi:ComF family protein